MNKKLLIIEDEGSLRTALKEKFEKVGLEISTASDGEEGLKKALDETPNLILLDLILPKMDGFAVLSELSKSESGKNIKVIILTNLSYSGNVGDTLKKGAADYLVKTDWTLEELLEKVKNMLGVDE